MSIKILEKNVCHAYGDVGLAWVQSLPLIINKLAAHWSLTQIEAVKNMSWHYVAYATQHNHGPVVLKISCQLDTVHHELCALKHFDGQGCIKLIDYNEEYHGILLERAMPGTSLKENDNVAAETTILTYAQIVKTLASQNRHVQHYEHMRTWCDAIDKINDDRINPLFVAKAKQIKSSLLNSVKNEYLCHGDLHLDNIIKQVHHWVAIDPKGIIGEMAFEASAFDLLDNHELNDASDIELKIINRVTLLANHLDIEVDRLLSWIFLRMMISAQWFVEDKGDPSRMLKLAQYVYNLLGSSGK